MSFKNASLPIAKFVPNWVKNSPVYRTPLALIDAARRNNFISASDLGVIGKLRKFKVSYYPVVCDAEGNCTDNVCDAGTRISPKQTEFNLTQCTASKVYDLAANDIRLIDDGGMSFSDHAKAQIASTMPSMRKVLSQQMQALLIAHTGLQLDGNLTHRLSMVNGTNGVVNPLGRRELERVFSNGGFNAPVIIGGTEVDNWMVSVRGAGNNQAGNNIGSLSVEGMYYDPSLNDTYGDGGDHVLAFDPSVLKFISWSKYQGMFATDVQSIDDLDKLFKQSKDGGSIRGSLLDPVYGLLWDIRIKWHDCGGDDDDDGYWSYQYRLYWDIFFMPDQVCNIQGVNGIFHFTTCPPVLAPCPTGDALPDPVAAATYSWNPSVSYPFYVASLNVAGQQTTPNVNVTSDADMTAMLNDNSGIAFTLSGSNIQYTGYSAITGNLNGNVSFTFV